MRSDWLRRRENESPVTLGLRVIGRLITRFLLLAFLGFLPGCRNIKSYYVDSVSFRNTTSSFPQVPSNAQPAVMQGSHCFWAGAGEGMSGSG